MWTQAAGEWQCEIFSSSVLFYFTFHRIDAYLGIIAQLLPEGQLVFWV